MSTPMKIAVIGAGSMGCGTARAVAADPAWELVAICDLDPEVRATVAEEFPGVAVTDDTPGVLADPAIDAVAITTLADVRPRLLRQALARGKHVWAEKPLAARIEDEEALLEEIEASGLHVCVNLFNRNGAYHERIDRFMTHDPTTLADTALVRDAVQLVREHRFDELPVVDARHHPVGLIDVQDLVSLKVIAG